MRWRDFMEWLDNSDVAGGCLLVVTWLSFVAVVTLL